MKKITAIFYVMIFFMICEEIDGKTTNVPTSKCSKGFRYYTQIKTNYDKHLFMYPAKKVKATYDDKGDPVYVIKKRNKEILYLNDLTKISCNEAKDGTYIVTIDILEKWEKWLTENCKTNEL
jgi:hypothetical protein